jgi:ferredoxin
MAFVITEPCVGTKTGDCVDVCPVDCIHEASDQYYVDPEVCIDCGACEPACPVQAIFLETEVPSKWNSYIQKNRTLAEKK